MPRRTSVLNVVLKGVCYTAVTFAGFLRYFQQCLIFPLHILLSDTERLAKKKEGEEEHFLSNSTESPGWFF